MVDNVMRRIFKFKGFWISMSIAFLFSALLYFDATCVFNTIELKSVDLRFLLRGAVEPRGSVAMAFVGEKSIKELGRWPWSRKLIAQLIQTLNEYGAKTIGFDVLFTDPEVSHEFGKFKELSESFISLGLMNDSPDHQAFFDELMEAREESDNDALMASVMEDWGNVVLGMAFVPSKKKPEDFPPYLVDAAYVSFGKESDLKRFEPLTYNARILPVPVLANATKNLGFVNSFTDPDGALRREMMAINHDGAFFAPLGLRIAQAYLGVDTEDVTLYANERITLGGNVIPVNSEGFALINYYGPNYTIPSYPVVDILRGRVAPEKLKNKAVIVGGAAIGMADLWPSPFSPALFGVEKQATTVENILQNDFLRCPTWVTYVNIAAVLFLGVLMGIVLPSLTTMWSIPFALICFLTYSAVVQFAFVKYRLLLNFTCPALEIVLVYTAVSAYRYLTEERDRKFLQVTFASYLAPELIEDMFNSKTMPELGGEARTITAYFTDIEDFSAFSEKLTAQQLVELLNEYLCAMTDILISEKGTLDKYEGDAIIAFFGAPMELPDHGLRAARVAVVMQNKLLGLREKWRNEKQSPDEPNRNTKNLPFEEWAPGDKWPKIVHRMKMRIGINTGEIVVGNMGSSMRMNYTMMGDPVNIAARLEVAGKQYGVYTLVSEYTLDLEFNHNGEKKRIMDMVEARMIDNITVVGKSEPVKVYEVCAMKGDLSDQEKELFKVFDEGMQHYLKMEWDEAVAKFNEALKIERVPDGKTTPSEVYIQRCKAFKENPPVAPGEKWDGVFRLTRK